MASIEANTRGNKKTARSRAKHNLNVDLTPMVDLGFLLITFFMLTARLVNGEHHLLMQNADKNNLEISNFLQENKALTLLLSGNNRVQIYSGETPSKFDTAKISTLDCANKKSIQYVVKQFAKRNKIANAKNLEDSLAVGHVFIKPDSNSNYENIVTALDAIILGQIQSYSIETLNEKDKLLVQ